MVDLLIVIIGACLLLYITLGGSDFGAGILELLPAGELRDAQKRAVNAAMGPVWEANHMWLILVVVILFMGFPPLFTTLMVSLHVPMLALLGGIVVRGCAFTFRHYDAVQSPRSQRVYTWLFGLSSLWTSWWLGTIAASLHRGIIDPEARSVWSAYFAPWWGWYPMAVAGFVTCIFVFLASVFLIGETEDPALRRRFTRAAIRANIAVVLAGGAVFLSSFYERENLFNAVTQTPAIWVLVAAATGLLVLLWNFVNRRRTLLVRTMAAGQVALILGGWYLLYVPRAVTTVTGPVRFHDVAAPPATLTQLLIALVVGSGLIFPALYYLLRVFKLSPPSD
ncbi:cytochrome d ubiquinol oxidase subunit II [Synoicihabitans lomoniglobus]|uniref:Cytochrome d ubiquinol oxidase subunit II n=1 Tax=Synoicihabitans lomoniglobus TaxID=2909285 RepID=A0AAF0I2D8_9BACT|nr:cytochrome d ubiquinol oxidase subunit II [Opitutaceae bacterium LMO-M01]WED66447.1 cytochrome d ubiquinol oxidase subunit II [Opitutaceae bacterium LMO-M01]